MREISNVFRPRKLVPRHFQWNVSILVTWSDTSQVCKLWWRKCQWVRFWIPRIPYILYVFLWIPIHFPKLKQKYSRAWTLGVATRETRKGTRRWIPEEVGERRNTFAKQTWTDRFFRLCFRHTILLYVFVTHPYISTQILKTVYAARTRTWLFLVVIPRSADCSCVLSNSATSCPKWTQ